MEHVMEIFRKFLFFFSSFSTSNIRAINFSPSPIPYALRRNHQQKSNFITKPEDRRIPRISDVLSVYKLTVALFGN